MPFYARHVVPLCSINGLFDPEEYDMMCLDYPKLSQYYAELVAHCLLNGVVEYGVLPSLVGKLREVTGRVRHDEKFLGQALSVLNRVSIASRFGVVRKLCYAQHFKF